MEQKKKILLIQGLIITLSLVVIYCFLLYLVFGKIDLLGFFLLLFDLGLFVLGIWMFLFGTWSERGRRIIITSYLLVFYSLISVPFEIYSGFVKPLNWYYFTVLFLFLIGVFVFVFRYLKEDLK